MLQGGLILALTAALAVVAPTGTLAAPFAYITNEDSDNLSVLDLATNEAVNVNTGHSPWGVAVNSQGTLTYVTNSGDGTLSVLDTETNTIVATIAVGNAPRGVAV